MQLIDLRNEVLAHGFESQFFLTRINQYLNDAQAVICRRVDYYIDEATQTYATVAGTTDIALPANWARTRSLLDTDREQELAQVGLRDIDRASVTQGIPVYYAQDAVNLRLYPTPDGVYDLELRYWKMPADLVNDTDTPTLPVSWHRLLWYWAVKECFASEDDPQSAQYWEQQFNGTLAEFMADQRFPSTDAPTIATSMWGDEGLGVGGWRRWPDGF